MKEQSHKDEMASALRGDFARLRSRGVATTLAPPAADGVPSSAAPDAPGPDPEPDVVPAEPEPPAPERPWIARFLGSR